uniref:Uncharacterized protein n=1 Tax=viral metagenome TaxID=1070528 RepID=A0A6M3JIK4_9ZZZZ
MKTQKRNAHIWKWIGHGSRALGSAEYAVDFWVCSYCGKEVSTRTTEDPGPGRCPGWISPRIFTI